MFDARIGLFAPLVSILSIVFTFILNLYVFCSNDTFVPVSVSTTFVYLLISTFSFNHILILYVCVCSCWLYAKVFAYIIFESFIFLFSSNKLIIVGLINSLSFPSVKYIFISLSSKLFSISIFDNDTIYFIFIFSFNLLDTLNSK